MGFDNWKVTKLHRAKRGIGGFYAREPSDRPVIRLLLVDDEYGIDEKIIREEYFSYLTDVNGAPFLGNDMEVHVFHTESFPLGRDVIDDFQRYDIDGALLDLRDGSTGGWAGHGNVSQVRNLELSPPLGTLVLSQWFGTANEIPERVESFTRGNNYAFAARKAPGHERREEELHPIRQFFDYVTTRRHYMDQPWAREYARFVGTTTRNKVLDFISILKRDAERRMPVVILGETGTGKELVARMIHAQERWGDLARTRATHEKNSARPNAPFNQQPSEADILKWSNSFQPVLVGAIPAGTLESDLFGIDVHQDLKKPVIGYCRAAAHGTLFLDEVGDLPLDIQGKLLRFLQEDAVHPVGADNWIIVEDVRKVFATNKDLAEMCEKGEMRSDFLHRIDGLTIRLPTLAERVEDHEELIDHFIRTSGYKERTGRSVEEAMTTAVREEIVRLCTSGGFTGNVRQLERFIYKLLLMAGDNGVEMSHLEWTRDAGCLLSVG